MAKAKTKKKPNKKLAQLAKMMRGIDLCMLTTHGPDKAMHARPMSNNGKVDFDGDAWFFTWRDTNKVAEIEKDNRVAISYVGGAKKSPAWISVSGTAEIVDDEEKKAELWVKQLDMWFPDGPEDPNVVLIHVDAKVAHWWTGEDEGEVKLGRR